VISVDSPQARAASRRVLPYSHDAETSVLGGILLHPKSFHQVADLVEAADFYHPVHAAIYRTMLELDEQSKPIDQVTVAEQMKANDTYGTLRAFNGEAYFAELVAVVVTVENIAFHARIVHGKATARRLIEAAQEIAAKGYGEYADVDEYIDEAERAIFEISQRSQRQGYEPIKRVLGTTIKAVEQRYDRKQAITGVPSGYHKLDALTAGFQPSDLVIIAARPSMGKCLTARTLIDDPETGKRITIEECVQRRLPFIHGMSDEGRIRVAPIGDWIDSGLKPAFRVRTRTGREVEVTGHHPFFTVEGWTPLHDLAAGARIAVPRAVPVFGTREMPLPLVRLLAYFIAEGCLTQSTPRFTNSDEELVADFQWIVREHFPTCHVRQYGIDYAVATERSGGKPNPVKEWLRALGVWGKLAEEKRFPDLLWMLPRAGLAEFLRILFSCDGTIYAMAGYPRIEFTVASEGLAQDVHHALTRFGVVSKLWRKTERSWRVEITEPEAVATFQREIGWRGEKARRFVEAQPEGRRANVGHAPRETWRLVRAACARKKVSLIEMARQARETDGYGKHAGYNAHARRGIPRSRLSRYAEILDDVALRRVASADLYWDEIVEITPIGEQQVYDLSVPDGANFVAQDVLVHNTSLVMNTAQNAAIEFNVPVLVFSLEMSKESLVERLLCCEARVDSTRLRGGFLEQRDWINITKAASRISEAPIWIDDSGAPTLLEIRAKCRRWRSDPNIFSTPGQHGMVVIDYLQLIHGRPAGKDQNREREISEISRGLKSLAKELRVPIIALSQLNRGVEGRSDKRPQLSDLRESGAIEQDADVIAFIYRDEVYNKDSPDKGVAEIIVGKQRNGPTGTVRLAFLNQYTRFENLAEGRDD